MAVIMLKFEFARRKLFDFPELLFIQVFVTVRNTFQFGDFEVQSLDMAELFLVCISGGKPFLEAFELFPELGDLPVCSTQFSFLPEKSFTQVHTGISHHETLFLRASS